jgi:hypothetical protein
VRRRRAATGCAVTVGCPYQKLDRRSAAGAFFGGGTCAGAGVPSVTIAAGLSNLQAADSFTVELWFLTNSTAFASHMLWEGRGTGNGWGSSPPLYEQEMHTSMGAYTTSNGHYVAVVVQREGSEPLSIVAVMEHAHPLDRADWARAQHSKSTALLVPGQP